MSKTAHRALTSIALLISGGAALLIGSDTEALGLSMRATAWIGFVGAFAGIGVTTIRSVWETE